MNIIDPSFLIEMYKKGFFPMAKNALEAKVNFYKPNKRFLIPIQKFHIPKKIFKEYKKKN